MATQVTLFAAAGFLLIGLLLLIGVRSLERRGGPPAATGAIVVGLGLLVLALVLGLLGPGAAGVVFAVAAAALVAWAGVVYAIYRARDEALPAAPTATTQCVPVLTIGNRRGAITQKSTFRTFLKASFDCGPTNDTMPQQAAAFGKAYYGLWFTAGLAVADPRIDILCQENDPCRAVASEVGTIEELDGPVRVFVNNVIQPTGAMLTVVTKMAAALNASGGPTLTVTPASPLEVTIAFPDASLASVEALGTYEWVCRREEKGAGSPPVG